MEDNEVAELTVNIYDVLPAVRSFVHYNGSLTTPPCTEVMMQPENFRRDSMGPVVEAPHQPPLPPEPRGLEDTSLPQQGIRPRVKAVTGPGPTAIIQKMKARLQSPP